MTEFNNNLTTIVDTLIGYQCSTCGKVCKGRLSYIDHYRAMHKLNTAIAKAPKTSD